MISNDVACKACGETPERRQCEECGVSAMIVDCGHQAQPRPIAADDHGHDYCDDCFDFVTRTKVRK